MAQDQGVLYDPRFLESFTGTNILNNPRTAIVELVANAWDAGATRVDITWPDESAGICFSICDNGHGMDEKNFNRIWRTLAYNRQKEEGEFALFPKGVTLPPRYAFGRNGKGRFAGFCFGDEYFVETWRDGKSVTYKVSRGMPDKPFDLSKETESENTSSGTKVFTKIAKRIHLPEVIARAEIGMRFLTDPNFNVTLNGKSIKFTDIPEAHIKEFEKQIEGLGLIKIIVIDLQDADKTTYQHGIAWHVKNRLVGDCSWKVGGELLLDGRTNEAKRYVFIVKTDFLDDAVLSDWSGFDESNQRYTMTLDVVLKFIKETMLDLSKTKRSQTFDDVKKQHRDKISKMSMISVERWENFVHRVQEDCPSIKETDLSQLAGILANLEISQNQYGLLNKLSEMQPGQLDELHVILKDWTLDMAKVVLDELQNRLSLLDKLKEKVFDAEADEVQELQPLFHRGLWIFGPEYETIEFTSNEGMTKVVRKLFKSNDPGSQNRPDFVILPESTVGLYYYPRYDDEGAEYGTDRLTIVELKRSGIPIGEDQKAQCWKYIKELYSKGLLDDISKVTCFVLGSTIDPQEVQARKEMSDRVVIQPLDYNSVIARANSRLHRLYDRVRSAPFLSKEVIDDFVSRGSRFENGRVSLV
ncbi:ATP-binding protein [Desulfovibrio sp. JY]|nr:ATP-binding protein [Desulfovibrio sp. JY]